MITVTADGERFRVETESRVFHGAAIVAGADIWVTLDGAVFTFPLGADEKPARAAARAADAFTPPMPATVVRIAVTPGDAVKDGDVLIALEAMKMELPIRAPRDGIVRALHCREGELVQPGHVLLDFE